MKIEKTGKKGERKKTDGETTKNKTITSEEKEKEQKREKDKKGQSPLNFPSERDKITEIKVSNEKKISEDKYFYVYGLSNNRSIELDHLRGLKDKPIQKFDFKDLSVLFSFYPHLHPILEEKEVMHHAEILNKLIGKTTIIPMAFGTVFKDKEILETILTKSYPAAKKTLEIIKDKIELGIKAVKKESEEAPNKISEEILGELGKLSVKNVFGDKFSDRLLLNNSFLVERKKFTQFSNKVGELEEKYPDLKFIYTGPWPAFSFVNININAG